MDWPWVVLTVFVILILELLRYQRTNRSMQDNRLQHMQHFDGFLSSMERYLHWKWDAYGALFEWDHKKRHSAEEEIDALRRSIIKLLDASGQLTPSQQQRVDSLSRNLHGLVEQQRAKQSFHPGQSLRGLLGRLHMLHLCAFSFSFLRASCLVSPAFSVVDVSVFIRPLVV